MPVFSDPAALRQVALFEDLTLDQLSHLNGLLHRKAFSAGMSVMMEEQPGEVAYVILSGTVKIYIEGEEETDVILAVLGHGEVVGEMSLVDSLGRSASVVALEDSTLLWIDRTAFWECLRTIPVLTFNLTRVLSRRVRLANVQVHALATLDVPGRVARQLLAFAQEYGQEAPGGGKLIPIRLTQTDLAGLVGASRVRVNQALVQWKRRKIISVDDRHRITIHNPAPLARLCDQPASLPARAA